MLQRLTSFYKLLARSTRLAISLGIVGLILAGNYFTTIPPLEETLGQRENQREVLQRRLANLRRSIAKLPDAEREVVELKNSIEREKKPLPDTVSIDQILRETEVIAQKTAVNLHRFSPGEAVLSKTPFQYFRIPIRIELSGTYRHLAIFFDRLVHLGILLHLENINLARRDGKETSEAGKGAKPKKNLIALKGEEPLNATAEIMAFRAAAPEEIAVQVVPNPPPAEGKQPP